MSSNIYISHMFYRRLTLTSLLYLQNIYSSFKKTHQKTHVKLIDHNRTYSPDTLTSTCQNTGNYDRLEIDYDAL